MDNKKFSFSRAMQTEAELLGTAAKQMFKKSPVSAGEGFQRASVAFKGETVTNKMAVVGGLSSGITLALTGLRNIRNGMNKDSTGKRDYALAALGAAEAAGGAFVTALFYERLKVAGGLVGKDAPSR